MKALLALVVAIVLTGCQKGSPAGAAPQGHHGRYAGIGLYSADRLWAQMKLPSKPKDDAGATTADDQTIIVVVDSETGEVRQCGNMSGYCIGMNPWTGPLGRDRTAPTSLNKHLAELGGEEAAASNVAENATDNTQSR